jgi:hypothetical protein
MAMKWLGLEEVGIGELIAMLLESKSNVTKPEKKKNSVRKEIEAMPKT